MTGRLDSEHSVRQVITRPQCIEPGCDCGSREVFYSAYCASHRHATRDWVYVAVDALLDSDALAAAAEANRSARDQIEYFGASDYDGPIPSEAAVRAAIESVVARV